jgi:DNA invertase Pin-like site-specific DNA recombinase
MVRAAAVYVRISEDRDGDALGVQRQEADCRALCKRKGWPVAKVYCDNDFSAANGRQARPAYRQLLADIKDRKVDAVVVWALDRLHRRPMELEEFFQVCENVGLVHMASYGGDVDLATGDGKLVARIKAAVDADEIEKLRRRVRRKHEELARAGRVGGGGARPYGFEADRSTIRESEAAYIREAARRLLGGESTYAILTDWQRRGVPSASGAPWRTTSLRRILCSPRVAGKRELRGEVIGPAVWPAILDERTWTRVRAIFADKPTRKGGRPHRFLLSGGIVRCGAAGEVAIGPVEGICGQPMTSRRRADGTRCYACDNGPDFDGCGRITVLAEPLEDLVRHMAVAALAGPKLVELRARAAEGDEQAERLQAERDEADRLLDQLADWLTDSTLDRPRYLRQKARVEARRQDAQRALDRLPRLAAVADLPRTRAELEKAFFKTWDVDRQRSVLRMLLEAVVVKPIGSSGGQFDHTRIEPVWLV